MFKKKNKSTPKIFLTYLYPLPSPFLPWTGPTARPVPSALDRVCPCTDSEWSSDPPYRYGRIRSSDLSACSLGPHLGLERSSPVKQRGESLQVGIGAKGK